MEGKTLLIIGALAAVYYFFKSSESSTKMLGLLVLGALGLGYIGNRHGGIQLPGAGHGKDSHTHNRGNSKVADKATINTLIAHYHIDELYDAYCKGSNRRESTCQCFVKPLYDDMRTDFSKRQLERLKEESNPILHRKMRDSYNAQQKEIAACLEHNNSSIDKELTGICKTKRHY